MELLVFPVLFDRALVMVLDNEGGYVDPEQAARYGDPGGASMRGITDRTLKRLRAEGEDVPTDPRDVTRQLARRIYFNHYWKPVRGVAQYSPGLAVALFDAAVQHGPGMAVRMLQEAIGSGLRDGHLGSNTLLAVRYAGPVSAILKFHTERRGLVARWVVQDQKRVTLLVGMLARIDRAQQTALAIEAEEECSGRAQFRDVFNPGRWRGCAD